MTINYSDLTKHFLFGGPVRYHNQRCHVIAMNDLLHTVTLKNAKTTITDINPEEVQNYEEENSPNRSV